ncbi:MAG TPA: radical SAM protein [Polyangiaceae bacterium]|nr:radical SAM protein [Polyangiaceae bacterium]
MRIALLYPPPWKLPSPGEPDGAGVDGPPPGYAEGDLDPDFHQIPYGLLSLGAQAARAGHQVKVFNLSALPWGQVEAAIQALDADLFGMSCWTANRRGVDLVARSIRRAHPAAHIVVGGPHATPLAREVLQHYPAVDTVAVGESEDTFLELALRLARGEPTRGIAGTWYREGGAIAEGPPRKSSDDLDRLASPHDYFATHILMTSRGCPWQCTFCGAEATWGRGFRGRSVPRVLDDIESALSRLPVKMIQIKDDTFTANKRRALEICNGIRERGLEFSWSCDTRVDVLTDELLRAMRLAGCQRLSLGVESGSPSVLAKINKKISVEQILRSTALAKRYGIQVRYYMMLGNRGETLETFHETLAFLERAKPHQYIFSCLSIYPGTLDFEEAESAGGLDRSVYFTERFQELKTPFDADAACTRAMSEWFARNKGLREGYVESVADARAILDALGDYHGAHLDLAGALYRAGELAAAEQHVRRALELGYPSPGVAYNYLACIAQRRGDLKGMQDHFMTAAKADPQHHLLMSNVARARRWFRERGPERGLPLELEARHDFQLFERTVQPTLPGPLPADFADWTEAATLRVERRPGAEAPGPRRLPLV